MAPKPETTTQNIQMLLELRKSNPLIPRSADPPVNEVYNHRVTGFDLFGKQIIIELENEYEQRSDQRRWTDRP